MREHIGYAYQTDGSDGSWWFFDFRPPSKVGLSSAHKSVGCGNWHAVKVVECAQKQCDSFAYISRLNGTYGVIAVAVDMHLTNPEADKLFVASWVPVKFESVAEVRSMRDVKRLESKK